MSGKGALISPALTARVHWALGAASQANPERAIMLGTDLIAAIQQELRETYEAGINAVRATQPKEYFVGPGGASPDHPGSAVHSGGNGLVFGARDSEYGAGGALT